MPMPRPFSIALLLALPLLPAGAAVLQLAEPLVLEGKDADRRTLVWINTRHWTRASLEDLRDALKAAGRTGDLEGVEAALGARDHWPEERAFPTLPPPEEGSGDPLVGWDRDGRALRRDDLGPGVDLSDARFLPGAKLEGLDLRAVRFDGADLQGADLRGSHLLQATFVQANLQGARLPEPIRFHDHRFREAFLGAADPATPPSTAGPETRSPRPPRATGDTLSQNGLEVRIRAFAPESLLGRVGAQGIREEWVLHGLMAGAPRRLIPDGDGLFAVMDDGRTLLWLSRKGCAEIVFPEGEGPIGPVDGEGGKIRLILEKGKRLVQLKRGKDGRFGLAGVVLLTPEAVAAAMRPSSGNLGAWNALKEATEVFQARSEEKIQKDRCWSLSRIPGEGAIAVKDGKVNVVVGNTERAYRHSFKWTSTPPHLLRDRSGQTLMLLDGRLHLLQFRNLRDARGGVTGECSAVPLANPLLEKGRVNDMCLGPDGQVWFTGAGFQGLGRVDAKGAVSFHAVPGVEGGGPRAVASLGPCLYLLLGGRASILVYHPGIAALHSRAEQLRASRDEWRARKDKASETIARLKAEMNQLTEERARARKAQEEAAARAKAARERVLELQRMIETGTAEPRSAEEAPALPDRIEGNASVPVAPAPESARQEAAPAEEEGPWEWVKGRPRFRRKAIDWNHVEAFHMARSPRFKSRFDARLATKDIGQLIEETLAEPHMWRRSGDAWAIGRHFARPIGQDKFWGDAPQEDSEWRPAENLMLILDGDGTVRTAYPALSLPWQGPSPDGERKEGRPAETKAPRG